MDTSTPLKRVLGSTAAPLERSRGVRTVGDFLDFLPRRYLDPSSTTDLGRLHENEYVVVVARVREARTRPMRGRRGRLLSVLVTDGTHDLSLTYFSPYGHERVLVPGAFGLFAGVVTRYRGGLQLAHPNYELFDAAEESEAMATYGSGLVPVYLRVPRLDSWNLTKAARVLFDALDELPDPVPEDVRRRRGLVGLREAYRMLHLPRDRGEVRRGQDRLRYDEAFLVQSVLAQRRLASDDLRTLPRPVRGGGLLEAFDARVPFELTTGQKDVSAEILADLAGDRPMNRLLQGEVGSGKTVVALRAMLAVVDAGGQAALLAPTEVLAVQHHRSLTSLLGDLAEGGLLGGSEVGTRVALLTGSQPAGIRKRSLLDAASGAAGIVVGTHALIQEHVAFADLGLVVVDEQHRFGVEQRDALRVKAALPPHVLVMTATPIPRSVAMTVFGDMGTSVLRELPGGRAPVTTHVVPVADERWVQRTWERVAEEVRAGRQAFVVCPRIGDDDGGDVADDAESAPPPRPGRSPARSAYGEPGEGSGYDAYGDVGEEEDEEVGELAEAGEPTESDGAGEPARRMRAVLQVIEELRTNPALAGLRIETLHGRMSPEDKDAVMTAFAAGRVDVLVATTVIEVGVDVPNANVMVVLDADRFGVSQLHQLRGRIGRGPAAGRCLLMTEADAVSAGGERLAGVAATNDGFALARLDLEQRSEGDVLGAAQSGGRRQLRFLRLLRDEGTILDAREDAFGLLAADPALSAHPALRARLASALDEEQAAFLERG